MEAQNDIQLQLHQLRMPTQKDTSKYNTECGNDTALTSLITGNTKKMPHQKMFSGSNPLTQSKTSLCNRKLFKKISHSKAFQKKSKLDPEFAIYTLKSQLHSNNRCPLSIIKTVAKPNSNTLSRFYESLFSHKNINNTTNSDKLYTNKYQGFPQILVAEDLDSRDTSENLENHPSILTEKITDMNEFQSSDSDSDDVEKWTGSKSSNKNHENFHDINQLENIMRLKQVNQHMTMLIPHLYTDDRASAWDCKLLVIPFLVLILSMVLY